MSRDGTSGAAGDASGRAEFDRFASEYEACHNRSLPPGIHSSDFAAQKAAVLHEWVGAWFGGRKEIAVLDFGCGTGRTLAAVAAAPWCGDLAGVDESAASLDVARRALAGQPKRVRLVGSLDELGDETPFDLALMFNVLHHVPPNERRRVLGRIAMKLHQGGILAVWEHNPFNPVTRLLVAAAPMDRHACLVSRRQTIRLLSGVGFGCVACRYVNCLPPKLSVFRAVRGMERALSGVPLGTQYWALFRSREGRDRTLS
jgi:SAM-dependent methyltransferase